MTNSLVLGDFVFTSFCDKPTKLNHILYEYKVILVWKWCLGMSKWIKYIDIVLTFKKVIDNNRVKTIDIYYRQF